MDINKGIIDQQTIGIVKNHPDWFEGIGDFNQKRSRAFLALSVSVYLDIDLETAMNLITDGGNDAGIDALYIGEFDDFSFNITLFQSKYVFDTAKNSTFPTNSIQKIIDTVGTLFDLNKVLLANDKLKARVEEIRSYLENGYVPTVKCVMVNNGSIWHQEGDIFIANFLNQFSKKKRDTFEFLHFNHNDILNTLHNRKGVKKAQLRLQGKGIEESFNYTRAIISKISVSEIAKLYADQGDNLLERNVRRYLGVKSKVNTDIQSTLLDDEKRESFYFFNNGITMVCSKFYYNALQEQNWHITVEDLQVVNGGQTCKTIYETIKDNLSIDFSKTSVLVRIYEIGLGASDALISDITYATNSQSPINIRDLKSNDTKQLALEEDIKGLGYIYKRKRDSLTNGNTIPATVAAEAVYAIWRKKPDQAKFKKSELFGKFYDEVFDNLNGSQLILAVLVFRYCDNQRDKRDEKHNPYSNYFMAMIMGYLILKIKNLNLNQLNHNTFENCKNYFEQNKESLYQQSNQILEDALMKQYPKGYDNVELRQLSATFRRRDLIDLIFI